MSSTQKTQHPKTDSPEARALEGRIGWFQDHSMLKYVQLLTEIRDQGR